MKIIVPLLCSLVCVANVHAGDDIAGVEALAAKGDAWAQDDLAARYETGEGVPKNEEKAFDLYRQSAKSGHPIALFNLARFYDLGIGVPRDRHTADDGYRKAAEAGFAPAMLNLGINIASGEDGTADLTAGMMWLDLAKLFSEERRFARLIGDEAKVADWKRQVLGAFDVLKARISKEQFEEAHRRGIAWHDAYVARLRKANQSPKPALSAVH